MIELSIIYLFIFLLYIKLNFVSFLLFWKNKMSDTTPKLSFEKVLGDAFVGKKVSAIGVCRRYLAFSTNELIIYDIFEKKTIKIPDYVNKVNSIRSITFNNDGNILLINSNEDGKMIFYTIPFVAGSEKEIIVDNILTSAIDPRITDVNNEIVCIYTDLRCDVYKFSRKKRVLGGFKEYTTKISHKNTDPVLDINWKNDRIMWLTYFNIFIYSANNEQMLADVDISFTFHKKISRPSLFSYGNFAFVSDQGCLLVYDINKKCFVENVDIDEKKFMGYQINEVGDHVRIISEGNNDKYFSVRMESEINGEKFSQPFPEMINSEFYRFVSSQHYFFLITDDFLYKISFCTPIELIDNQIENNSIKEALASLKARSQQLERSAIINTVQKIANKQIELKLDESVIDSLVKLLGDENYHLLHSLYKKENLLYLLICHTPLSQLQKASKISNNVIDISYILDDLMEHNCYKEFSAIVRDTNFELPPRISKIILEGKMDKLKHDPNFKSSLMYLYLRSDNEIYQVNGIEIALQEKIEDVLQFIEENKMFKYATMFCTQFYKSFGGKFVSFLKEFANEVSSTDILRIIKTEINKETDDKELLTQFMMEYLDSLYPYMNNQQLREYSTDLAILYIKNNHKNTIRFLQETNYFDFSKAREAAIKYKRRLAAAYLCRKTGANIQGIDMLLNGSDAGENNPADAIEYAMLVDDNEIWKRLKEYSYKNINYLKAILSSLSMLRIDPVDYIKNIPDTIPFDSSDNGYELEIKEALNDFKIKLSTAKNTVEIIEAESFQIFSDGYDKYKSGKEIEIRRD